LPSLPEKRRCVAPSQGGGKKGTVGRVCRKREERCPLTWRVSPAQRGRSGIQEKCRAGRAIGVVEGEGGKRRRVIVLKGGKWSSSPEGGGFRRSVGKNRSEGRKKGLRGLVRKRRGTSSEGSGRNSHPLLREDVGKGKD